MTRKFASLLALVFVVPLCLAAQDAKTVLQAASKAMGDVRSIQYSGTGHLYALGQAYSPTSAWPQNNSCNDTRSDGTFIHWFSVLFVAYFSVWPCLDTVEQQ